MPNKSEIASPARRWLAIAMMDVVGFTSLTERDEIATLRRWEELLMSCVEPAIGRYGGDVFRKLGDGILVAFNSAQDAIACLLEIQRCVALEVQDSPLMRLRGAINAGEVTVWNGDMHGTAVNIAARLQEFAAPGGIVISDTVEALVRDHINEAMEDLGDLTLKGIERRVRAYSLLEKPAWSFAAHSRPSIAVLPFVEHDARDGEYFGDGIVEDIVNSLAALPELFVVSRSSTLAFRGGTADLRKVRNDLGVRYVLSGSVRRANDRIRVATELSDSESLNVLWSDRIDGRFDDIFDLQDRLSQQIVATIAPHVQKAEMMRASRKRPESLNAYDCFLRGLDLVYRLEREKFDFARAMFARAIALDPDYAPPYAYSALWHAVRIGQGWSSDTAADQTAVTELADAALERDSLDATSLALCGHVRSILFRDFHKALELFDRAIAASPNSAIAWTRSSPTFSYLGDWKEARRRAEQGLRLSPLDRHVFYTYTVLALAAYTGQDFDEAIDWGYRAMAANPNFTANLRVLGASLSAAGRMEEAKQVSDWLLALEPDFSVDHFCSTYAYKNPRRRERLAVHLKEAGLPH